MKILITGGAGFIGSNITGQLLDQTDHEIIIYDNLSEQIHGNDPKLKYVDNPKVKFVKGDVRDLNLLTESVLQANIIIHLASETGTGQSMYDISQYTSVNVDGTSNLLHILGNHKHQVKKIVLSSSRSIYGEGKYRCSEHGDIFPKERDEKDMKEGIFDPRCPICGDVASLAETTEDSAINPLSYYALTKTMQEDLLKYGSTCFDFDYVVLRYQNVYGPGQSLKNPYTGILSIFTNLMKLNKEEINIFEDGLESRDFVYIDDVARATIDAALNDDVTNETINIGSGVPTSVMTVAETIKSSMESSIQLRVSGDYRVGDIRHNIADLTRAKSLLGFRPTVDFQEGIQAFLNWAKAEDAGEDLYAKSLAEMKEKGLMKSK